MKPKFQWWIWRFRCTLFEAKEISKIMKPPSSMKNGRFHFPNNSKIKKKIIN
jgi:hypothetical protein